MTDPNAAPGSAANPVPPAAATAPAGWYPVAAGSTQQRWWDGATWTEHVYDPATAQPAGPLKAAEGTSPNTVWFWLLAVGAPLFQLAAVLLEGVWFRLPVEPELRESVCDDPGRVQPELLRAHCA